MCGILGLFQRGRSILPSDEDQLARALEKLAYRGPNGSGLWKSDRCILGHRRLSIIDLSPAGAQPFVNDEIGLAITFNGEIYNYKEIRSRLASLGYRFHSQSDTEVILYAYDHYGTDFVRYLRGMFAFCIFDLKHNFAVLGRDPAGEKPLYYYLDNERFVFSSEIKAFHAFSDVDLSIDVESVKAFFTLQYIPGPHTIYSQIHRLPAGCVLKLGLDHWEMSISRYWSFENQPTNPATPEEVDELLAESVRYRLVADVEVGLLLSGGIDSALIASYAQRNGVRLRAFTAKFDEENLDESPYSRQVADQLGLQQIFVTGGRLTPAIFDQVIFHGDELLGDPACIPTFLLSQEISSHLNVVLSGEGADELFWGYDTYRMEKVWQRISWLRSIFSHNKVFQNLITRNEIANQGPPGWVRLGKILSAEYNLGAARWTSVFADHTINHLFSSNRKEGTSVYLKEMAQRLGYLEKHMTHLDASLSIDLLYWLTDDLLMKVDRMTMAHGVEARAPYLDPYLILKAMALPPKYKVNGKSGKLILRNLVEKHFPGETGRTLAWRKKHGFEVPIGSWLRTNLRECVEDRLSPRKIARSGFLNPTFVSALKKNFYSSSSDTPLRRKMWMLLCFQSWFEIHEKGFGFRQNL